MPAVGAFFAGIGAGFTLGGATIVAAGGAFSAGIIVGQFLAANIGTILIAGASLLGSALLNNRRRPMESSTVNVRIAAAPRLHVCGVRKVGGAAVFGAFDAEGAFWYVIVHCDSELMELDHYRFDDREIEVDEDGVVLTEDFWAETENGGLFGLQPGERKKFFTIWTTTFTPADPVPPAIPELGDAFAEWTADHLLVGTTYSVIKVDPVDETSKPNVFKWRGPFGVGEPALSIVGTWSRVYDPREPGHDIDDPMTWEASRNAALVWAWQRYRQFGFGNEMDSINWDELEHAANICDHAITDVDDNVAPRYEVGVAFFEDDPNTNCEQDILAACDGVVLYDTEGKAFISVGYWEGPDLTLTAARDILAMSSREAEDGESETDGVVVTYTEPGLGHVEQPCAPWNNPEHFDPARTPNYLQVSIPAIQNHNQAVRIAKAIGYRSQATHRLGPTVGLRSLMVRRKRLITLEYDDTFNGPYQVVTPVEIDESGTAGIFGLVPTGPNNWTLLPGEEGQKPTSSVAGGNINIPLPDNVEVGAESVPGSGGTQVILVATFDPPTSPIYHYEFVFSADGGTTWETMTTDMENQRASSVFVPIGEEYLMRWRTLTTGGNSSAWSSTVSVLAIDPPTFDSTGSRFDTTIISWDAE